MKVTTERYDYNNGTAVCLEDHINGQLYRNMVRIHDTDDYQTLAIKLRALADAIDRDVLKLC